jgi:tripeptidyl-peptidase-1
VRSPRTPWQVESFVAPKQETLDAVHAFLSAHGITSTPITPAGDLLSIAVTVAQANTLFNTQFETFEAETGAKTVRTLEYSLPAGLKDHLEYVHPTTTSAMGFWGVSAAP